MFDVTLVSPATARQKADWAPQLREVCDRFIAWEPTPVRPRWQRALALLKALPVNVVVDRTPQALAAVRETLAQGRFDVAVFDFVHASVLVPDRFDGATVCFTHNVEAEIFARHVTTAKGALMRRAWDSQHAKMQRFESESLRRFSKVVAVSERDATQFRDHYGLTDVEVIPTGVDLDFFDWREPPSPGPDAAPTVVFTGSMDWAANVDGVQYFLDEVWPLVLAKVPRARFVVVGRNAPASLVKRGRSESVSFTGFVDDVRPHVHAAQAFVIPLRVGGGTRIKAFEAMAMGCPVVSTSIGIEGLKVVEGEHYLRRDSAAEQAAAVVLLLRDGQLRGELSRRARGCVEEKFGHRVAATVFEGICIKALDRSAAGHPAATAG